MTEQYYFRDPLRLEFTADIIESGRNQGGKAYVCMPGTYFYPTSGGQDHDTGWIGNAKVLDVFKEGNGRIVHILDQVIDIGIYKARIEKESRMGNMQAHTAQHLLSRCIEIEMNLETVSANINSEKPSTIDLNSVALSNDGFKKVEILANRILQENRQVKSYFINEKDIPRIPFRRAPKVSGEIRVVEIDGFDYSACGGTHCPQTGMLGVIKIVKQEIQNQKTRIHFVTGMNAVLEYQTNFEIVKAFMSLLGTNEESLLQTLNKKINQFEHVQKELIEAKEKLLEQEIIELSTKAKEFKGLMLTQILFQDRAINEVRKIVISLRSQPRQVVVMGSVNGDKLSVVAGCSDDCEINAVDLLDFLIDQFQGRCGGDSHLAQGGCMISNFDETILFQRTEEFIKRSLGSR